jgi:crossover junction endodeoxyribonuclease RusA
LKRTTTAIKARGPIVKIPSAPVTAKVSQLGNSLFFVLLPWPDKALSPNSRNKWAKIAAITAARYAANIDARNAGATPGCLGSGHLVEIIRIYPPDRRWYDNTNIVASLKAAEDGIFEACATDDHKVIETRARRMNVVKGGCIGFEIFSDDANLPCLNRLPDVK